MEQWNCTEKPRVFSPTRDSLPSFSFLVVETGLSLSLSNFLYAPWALPPTSPISVTNQTTKLLIVESVRHEESNKVLACTVDELWSFTFSPRAWSSQTWTLVRLFPFSFKFLGFACLFMTLCENSNLELCCFFCACHLCAFPDFRREFCRSSYTNPANLDHVRVSLW